MNRVTTEDRTVAFISGLQEENGSFRFHPEGSATLLSTCFGVQALFLLDKLELSNKEKVGDRIKSQQRSDGIFADKEFQESALTGLQKKEYLEWQFSYFSLIALDMLGYRCGGPLNFLEPYLNERKLLEWLESRNWDDFWYCSNEIMFLLYFLAYSRKYSERSGTWQKSMDFVFDYLDERQDEVTGYWGNLVRENPRNGMFGAAHIYLYYEFVGRTINHSERIIHSTIALQQEDGLYGPEGGGACEDYDAVEILVRMGPHCPDRQDVIHASISRMLTTVKNWQSSNGGYGYRLASRQPVVMLKRKINRALGRTKYRYSGWKKMECDMYRPDIWGTYFRLLTVAHAERYLGLPESYSYKSYDLPGWGFLRNLT